MYFKAQSFSNTSAIKMIHLNWNPETKVELKIEDVGQKSLMCAALGTRLTSQGDKSLSWQGFPPTRSPNPLVNAVLPAAREHAHTNTHTYTHTLCPSPQPYGNANWDLDLKQSFWSFYKWEKWGSKLHLIAQDYNLLSKDPATQLSSLLFLLFLTAQENQIAKSGKMEGSLCRLTSASVRPTSGRLLQRRPTRYGFFVHLQRTEQLFLMEMCLNCDIKSRGTQKKTLDCEAQCSGILSGGKKKKVLN